VRACVQVLTPDRNLTAGLISNCVGGDTAEGGGARLRFDAFHDVVVRHFAAAAGAKAPARPQLRARAFDGAGAVPRIAAHDPSAAAVEHLPSAYERAYYD
jgi:hypothetical protein